METALTFKEVLTSVFVKSVNRRRSGVVKSRRQLVEPRHYSCKPVTYKSDCFPYSYANRPNLGIIRISIEEEIKKSSF